jgi:tRNA nucleotidyltransferase (CCA-adding enzyme)
VLRVVGCEIDFALAPAPDLRRRARAGATSRSTRSASTRSRGELLDPLGGRARPRARACCARPTRARSASDPLRGLRVAQVAARFAMEPDAELVGAVPCAGSLRGAGRTRCASSGDKLLLAARRSRAAASRSCAGRASCASSPSWPALVGVSQDPRWHPEGDVWVHTELVVDAASALRHGRTR